MFGLTRPEIEPDTTASVQSSRRFIHSTTIILKQYLTNIQLLVLLSVVILPTEDGYPANIDFK